MTETLKHLAQEFSTIEHQTCRADVPCSSTVAGEEFPAGITRQLGFYPLRLALSDF
jgi:hypothetical protein